MLDSTTADRQDTQSSSIRTWDSEKHYDVISPTADVTGQMNTEKARS